MGIVIRQSIKASLVSYVGIILGAFCTLWLFPRYLSRTQIGTITFLENAALLGNIAASLGVGAILDRYLPQFRNPHNRHAGFLGFLMLYAGLGFGIFLILFYGFEGFWQSFYLARSPEMMRYFYLIPPFTFALVYLSLMELYARNHYRIVVPAIWRELVLRLLVIGGVLCFAWGYWDFEQVLQMRVVFYFIILLGVWAYLLHLKIWFWQTQWQVIYPYLAQMGTYSLTILPAVWSVAFIAKLDGILIPAFLSSADLGVYSLGFFMATVLEIPRRTLTQMSVPIISQAWATKDYAQLQKMYHQTARNGSLVVMLLLMGIWVNVDNLFRLMPNGTQFVEAKYVILWLGLTRWIDAASGTNNELIQYSPIYHLNLLLLILLFFVLWGLNVWLLPIWGITGAAIATFIAYTLFNLAKFIVLWRRYGWQPLDRADIILVVLAISSYALIHYIPFIGNVGGDILLRGAMVLIIFGGGIYALRLSPEIHQLIQHTLQRFRLS